MATDEAQPAAALAKTLDGLDLDGAAGAKGKKKTSSVAAFGTRVLQSPDEVWDHNAWDNAEWNDDDEAEAAKAVAKQRLNPVPAEQRDKYDREAAGFWDAFYAKNENRFFKDRHWLDLEFPELFNGIASGDAVDAPRINILEIGCGAGNTAFPLIAATPSNVFVYACDFSSTAIDVVRSSKEYDEKRCSAFVYGGWQDSMIASPISTSDMFLS